MPRPRLPAEKAEAAGSALIHPGRFKDRKPPKQRPIGEPYATMTEIQKAVWAECQADMPWLKSGHRLLLRQICILAARMETDPEMGVSAHQALSAMLSKLGATPTDETKVRFDAGDDEDPTDRFFARPN